MVEKFGSDSFFYQMKEAQQTQDRDRLAELLKLHVQRIGSFILRHEKYEYYSFHDRQDAIQDATLYVLGFIDGFLDDPRNDPRTEEGARFSEKQKNSWFYKRVFHGVLHSSKKILKNQHDSLDRPATGQNDKRSLGDVIPAPDSAADGGATPRGRLEEAFHAFFSLPNDPAIIAAVGFIILRNELRPKKLSLETYAEALRKTDMVTLIRSVEKLLREVGVDESVLNPLRKRINFAVASQCLQNVTAEKLTKRKSDMLKKLKGNMLKKLKEKRNKE